MSIYRVSCKVSRRDSYVRPQPLPIHVPDAHLLWASASSMVSHVELGLPPFKREVRNSCGFAGDDFTTERESSSRPGAADRRATMGLWMIVSMKPGPETG